jgi:hypothetical protein
MRVTCCIITRSIKFNPSFQFDLLPSISHSYLAYAYVKKNMEEEEEEGVLHSLSVHIPTKKNNNKKRICKHTSLTLSRLREIDQSVVDYVS